ncbi:hypothetical protein D3C86_788770 [compost metagenome]
MRLGDGAAHSRVGGQFDVQAASAHVDFAPRQIEVQADLRAARFGLGLDRVAAGPVDLDHVHLHHPVRSGQVGRDVRFVDVEVAAELDVAVRPAHGGQHPVGARLGDVVVDDAETGQFHPQGRAGPFAKTQISAAGHCPLDPVGRLEAFDHRLGAVEPTGQGDAFKSQPRGAVPEGPLGQVHAAVHARLVQRAGKGGARRYLARQ